MKNLTGILLMICSVGVFAQNLNTTYLGHWGSYGPCMAVTVSGEYCCLGSGTMFVVTDISDPSDPVETGALRLPSPAYDITIQGNFAYIADGWQAIRIIIA
ncbi:MAG: hypothetical protein JW861_08670 [Bacteroidales bacterium]|nr:hypothetical protein [Bacteroidales bacterium]